MTLLPFNVLLGQPVTGTKRCTYISIVAIQIKSRIERIDDIALIRSDSMQSGQEIRINICN